MTDVLTQKNTQRVNFQPKKICRTPLSCILRVPPREISCLQWSNANIYSHCYCSNKHAGMALGFFSLGPGTHMYLAEWHHWFSEPLVCMYSGWLVIWMYVHTTFLIGGEMSMFISEFSWIRLENIFNTVISLKWLEFFFLSYKYIECEIWQHSLFVAIVNTIRCISV